MKTLNPSQLLVNKQAFEKHISETINSIRICRENKFITSGLILIYSAIDTMAWLSRNEANEDSSRQDYYDWVKTYLLPGSKLKGTAKDLYAARCGLLHSHSSEARLIRKNEATYIYYSWGNVDKSSLERLSGKSDKRFIVIHFEDLFEAYQIAVQKYLKHVAEDATFANIFYQRTGKCFKNESPEIISFLNSLFA